MKQETVSMGRRALSGWPMILGWLAMIVFAFHASTHMVGAGDTWVAMACGRHFVSHGVDTVEPFSANSHKGGPTEQEIRTWPGWAQWITDKVGLETVKRWEIYQHLSDQDIHKLIAKEVKTPNQTLADFKRFKSFSLTYEEFPKTSTRKIKRHLFKEFYVAEK